jgi:type 1 fimbriae regulatory protein FimB/type 1 fimbriae regulatory protein FimE
MTAATEGRYGHRDRTLMLIMYRHGLRVSEAVNLRWDQIDMKAGLLAVQRLKKGVPSTHPVRGPELRALRDYGVGRRKARICLPRSAAVQ